MQYYFIDLNRSLFIKHGKKYQLAKYFYNFLQRYTNDQKSFKFKFLKQNQSRTLLINRFKVVKNPFKLVKNSIYNRKYYRFISRALFKKYVNILHLWFSKYTNQKSQVHRTTFILYLKHLNFSFFNKYIHWIRSTKRIVVFLNLNIVKNNLFYTLTNNYGDTLATLSSGLFYALPRNQAVKRNPFKKSIPYLTNEMFSTMFRSKIYIPAKTYTREKKLEFFKSLKNEMRYEWKKKKKKWYFSKQYLRVYFILKFLKHKRFFRGMNRKIISTINRRVSFYKFAGAFKQYPRVHNGCRKKKKRRL